MTDDLTNQIVNAGILRPPAPPRDTWTLGTVSGTPAAGIARVVLDGDTAASDCVQGAACVAGDRVLTCLLGRARIVVVTLGKTT